MSIMIVRKIQKKTSKGMRKTVCTFMLLFAAPFFVGSHQADEDPVLLRVGNREITRSEFVSAYRKNNIDMKVADPKTLEEYLELYIDFNLKVVEAESRGLDTLPAFSSELNRYREQLARPYFRDESVTEQMVEEAYERMQYDIRASHILIALEEHALPSDTLDAYNRIMEIRKRHKNGESFADLAEAHSDDASARDTPASANAPGRPGNKGDLPYFTAFNMVYPFESAAYKTPVGEVSMPVRTRFGYHIVKVRDRLPAMGNARVAHIMVMTPGDADQQMLLRAKERINEIYEKVQSGEEFDELARQYSEDQSSAARGGEMPAFQSNRMVPEFIEAIGSLKQAGDISPPVRTSFGWHIIKLLERNPVPVFDDIKEDLHNRVVRDSRGQLSQDAVVNQLKKEYGFGENLPALQAFFDIVDESFFQSDSVENMDSELDERLFWFGPHTFYQKDFAKFLRENYAPRVRMNYRNLVAENYKRFVQERLIAYEDGFLESKYPEFRAIMKEYHDGILLFEITDQVVWSKAVEDSVGLNAFFQENRDRYMWEERLDVTIYSAPDADIIQQARDILSHSQDPENAREFVLDSINAAGNQEISAQVLKLQKGDHPVTGMVDWKPGIYGPLMSNGQALLVQVHEVLPPRRQEKEEVMGLVIADFQNHLEKQWVRELRRKYEIVVNQDVLETIQF